MSTVVCFMKFCSLCLREKAFLTEIAIKVFKNVANVTTIRGCSQNSTIVNKVYFIDILLILIVQECFTVEKLNNLL